MMEKEDLRIKKTKASLYRTLLDLLKTKELEDIKISDICKKAKINRSTFYDHFKDKNYLLEELIKDLTIELENDIKLDKKEKTIKNYYQKMLKKLLDHIDKYKSTYKTINQPVLKEVMIQILTKEITKETNKILSNKVNNIEKFTLFYANGIIGMIIDELNNNSFDKNKLYTTINKLLFKNNLLN